MTGLLKHLLLIAMLAFTAGTLAACDDTIHGAGKDINDMAGAVEEETPDE